MTITSIVAQSTETAAQSKEGKRNETNTLDCERQNVSKRPDPFDTGNRQKIVHGIATQGGTGDDPLCVALSGLRPAFTPVTQGGAPRLRRSALPWVRVIPITQGDARYPGRRSAAAPLRSALGYHVDQKGSGLFDPNGPRGSHV